VLQKYVEEKLREKAQSDSDYRSDYREVKDNQGLLQLLSDNAEDVLDATFDLILDKTLLEWELEKALLKLGVVEDEEPQREPQSELDQELGMDNEVGEASEEEILEQMKAFMPKI
jgi:hypothetical protein